MYGSRVSLLVGICADASGHDHRYHAGTRSAVTSAVRLMPSSCVADIQLSFPAILIALLIDGVARVALPRVCTTNSPFTCLIFAIAASGWVQYARTVRGSTLVGAQQRIRAGRARDRPAILAIMFRHVPNVLGPVLVPATYVAPPSSPKQPLSFLGVGVPPATLSGHADPHRQRFLSPASGWITGSSRFWRW